ncbi:hypothetical protein O3P16_06800 [Chitinophagaceae bacterium LY-5]|uniref:Uncharacterized protein n=1 Tax=Polluticaenibacter yanchengensis TaxID=3014562 RepID=A0ABT4UI52_9BACT|nr:hypothetical protein [Chitinophagaceae bacterium LY-5]
MASQAMRFFIAPPGAGLLAVGRLCPQIISSQVVLIKQAGT